MAVQENIFKCVVQVFFFIMDKHCLKEDNLYIKHYIVRFIFAIHP